MESLKVIAVLIAIIIILTILEWRDDLDELFCFEDTTRRGRRWSFEEPDIW